MYEDKHKSGNEVVIHSGFFGLFLPGNGSRGGKGLLLRKVKMWQRAKSLRHRGKGMLVHTRFKRHGRRDNAKNFTSIFTVKNSAKRGNLFPA
jgi:hypothetical protein